MSNFAVITITVKDNNFTADNLVERFQQGHFKHEKVNTYDSKEKAEQEIISQITNDMDNKIPPNKTRKVLITYDNINDSNLINIKELIQYKPDGNTGCESNWYSQPYPSFQLTEGVISVKDSFQNSPDFKELKALKKTVDNLFTYAEQRRHMATKATNPDAKALRKKSNLAYEMAARLEQVVNDFSQLDKKQQKEGYSHFEEQFEKILNAEKYKPLSESKHRNYNNVILANIAIAFSLVGTFLLAAQIISTWKAGKIELFFEKPKGQSTIEDIGKKFEESKQKFVEPQEDPDSNYKPP